MDIKEIIKKAGGAQSVAERLGITSQAVYKWKMVPATKAKAVAKMAKLKPIDVRGDVFG